MNFDFKRVGVVLAVLIPVITFPMWADRVFPHQKEWCVRAYPNGQTKVLHGANCWRKE